MKGKPKAKVTTVFTIFEDPFTRSRVEGKARLVKRAGPTVRYGSHTVERWFVEFLDEPGTLYYRTIVR